MEEKERSEELKYEKNDLAVRLFTVIPVLMIICIIIALAIGIWLTNDQEGEIAEISKNSILGAEGITTESIGTNVNATFNSETGELTIASTTEIGTLHIQCFNDLAYKQSIKTITFENEVYAPENSNQLFSGLSNLTAINNLNNLNVSNANSMGSMFQGCSSLITIDISEWNIENLTADGAGLSGMFAGCSNLTSIGNIRNWNVTNVKNMAGMFNECRKLTSIDMRNWDMSGVTVTMMMFGGCTSLVDIYTPKVYSTASISLPTSYYNLSVDNGITEEGYTKIGTNVEAIYNEATKEIKIASTNPINTYESFTSGTFGGSVHLSTEPAGGTINRESLLSFYTTVGANNIQAITFENRVYAPSVSYGLFRGETIEDGLCNLASINNINYLDTSNVTTMEAMFMNCVNLTALDLSGFDTSNVTIMQGMFQECNKLTTIGDVGSWNTSKVTNMRSMFNKCKVISSINVKDWDTENVTTMKYMFCGCQKLEELDVSNWITTNVTDMEQMFMMGIHNKVSISIISELTALDVSSWDTTNVKNMNSMFYGCYRLTELDISDWNTTNVTDMGKMFYDCDNLTILDVSNWNTENVKNMNSMFRSCNSLTTLDVSNWKTGNVTDMDGLFMGCSNLTTIDVSNWNTGNVENMQALFCQCEKLTTVDVSNWNTENVTDMQQMFDRCRALTELNVSNWNTQRVTDIYCMFSMCSSLNELNVGGWKTSNVTNMGQLFEGCSNLTTLDVSNWNTESVTAMGNMFSDCSSLTTLDLSKWDTKNVEKLQFIFSGCTNLTSIGDTSNWNTAKVTNMKRSFRNCSSLTTLNMNNWDMSAVTNIADMLSGCTSLTNIYTPKAYSTQTVQLPTDYYNLSEECKNYEEGHTQIGKNVSGTFNEETGEMKIQSEFDIYNNFTQGTFGGSVHLSTEKSEVAGPINKTMFTDYKTAIGTAEIKSITFENEVFAPEDSSELFYYLNNVTNIDNIDYLNTSNVINMSSIFSNCSKLTALNLNDWNTENVTNMSSMFSNCSKLTALDLNDWNTENVTDMNTMFGDCSSLTSLDMSNWDMSEVSNVTMEMLNGCTSLTDIYTPKAYSTQTITLPTNDWYNVTNINDNNTYSNFKNDTFTDTGSIHLRKLVDYNITYTLDDGVVSEENPTTYNAVSNFTLNNPIKEGYRFTGWTGSNGETAQDSVSVNGREQSRDLEYTANYEINKYVLTINPNNGEWNDKTEVSTFDLAPNDAKTIENPTRVGYTFNGWNIVGEGSSISETTFIMGSVDTTLTADWIANTDTPYTVKHWQQKLMGNAELKNEENYTLTEIEDTLRGTTDTTVEPETKTHDGFTAPEKIEVTISGDGSTEVNYYYTRRTDLYYIVKYLENGTNNEIKEEKRVNNQTFENEISTNDEVIPIEGYIYNSIDKDTLTITTEENIINIYYIKNESLVVTHHYIYDEEEGNTLEKLIDDIEIAGRIGETYMTTPSNEVPANYECVNAEPERYTGTRTKDTINVNYYYKLKDPTIENGITITANVGADALKSARNASSNPRRGKSNI